MLETSKISMTGLNMLICTINIRCDLERFIFLHEIFDPLSCRIDTESVHVRTWHISSAILHRFKNHFAPFKKEDRHRKSCLIMGGGMN